MSAPLPGPSRLGRRARVGLGVAVAAATGALVFIAIQPLLAPPPPGGAEGGTVPPPRRSVAVLGIANATRHPAAAWLPTAVEERLAASLAAGGGLRLVPGENVARVRVELSLGHGETLDPQDLQRVRTNLGADLVALGSCALETGGAVRVHVRLQDAVGGATVAEATETGTDADLAPLVSRLGRRLRRQLGLPEPSAAQEGEARARFPSSVEASRLHAAGVEKLRLFDAVGARELLERAAAADPGSALVHSSLAAAWSALGYDSRALEEARRAFEVADPLPREERLLVEGRYHEAAKEWPEAARTYGELRMLFPDDVEHGLRLVAVQVAGGDSREALATVTALRALPAPVAEDPRIDLAEARVAESLSDDRRCLALAVGAARKARAAGARLLVARARLQEGWTLHVLGRPTESAEAFGEAKGIFASVGDRAGVAATLNQLATVRVAQGDVDEAEASLTEALALSREVGDRFVLAWTLTTFAWHLQQQGDLARAKAMLDESLVLKDQIGDRRGVAVIVNNIGNVHRAEGDLMRAKSAYEDSLAMCREMGDQDNAAWALGNLGKTLLLTGDLSGARAALDEALALRRRTGQKRGLAVILQALGDLSSSEDDLEAARRAYEEALALRIELGEKGGVAETRLALAILALDDGRVAEAEAVAREAAEELRRQKRPEAALAWAVLARGLVGLGQTEEATHVLHAAFRVTSGGKNLPLRLAVTVASARVRAVAGPCELCHATVSRALAEARRAGFEGARLEAELALGEIEIAAGQAGGRTRLEALAEEAASRGFRLVARKALQASARPSASPGVPGPLTRLGHLGGILRGCRVSEGRGTIAAG